MAFGKLDGHNGDDNLFKSLRNLPTSRDVLIYIDMISRGLLISRLHYIELSIEPNSEHGLTFSTTYLVLSAVISSKQNLDGGGKAILCDEQF